MKKTVIFFTIILFAVSYTDAQKKLLYKQKIPLASVPKSAGLVKNKFYRILENSKSVTDFAQSLLDAGICDAPMIQSDGKFLQSSYEDLKDIYGIKNKGIKPAEIIEAMIINKKDYDLYILIIKTSSGIKNELTIKYRRLGNAPAKITGAEVL